MVLLFAHVMPVCALICYCLSALIYISVVFLGGSISTAFARLCLLLGGVCHGVFLIMLLSGVFFGYLDIHKFNQWIFKIPVLLSFMCFVLVLLFILLSRTKYAMLGAFVMPCVALLMVYSSVLFHYVEFASEVTSPNILLILHVCVLLVGSACLILSSTVSVGLLLKESFLRRKRFVSILRLLPAVTALDTLHYLFIGCGLMFMACGVLAGVGLGVMNGVSFGCFEPSVVNTTLILSVYMVVGSARVFHGWRGTRAAWLSLVGGAVLLISLLLVHPLGSSFHVY